MIGRREKHAAVQIIFRLGALARPAATVFASRTDLTGAAACADAGQAANTTDAASASAAVKLPAIRNESPQCRTISIPLSLMTWSVRWKCHGRLKSRGFNSPANQRAAFAAGINAHGRFVARGAPSPLQTARPY